MAIKYLVILLIFFTQSCTHGLLYTHTTEPLTTNFQRTAAGVSLLSAGGSTKHIDLQLQAKWDSNGIGEIAKKNGINHVYYADLEVVSVLFGIWEQEYVHIYGQ